MSPTDPTTDPTLARTTTASTWRSRYQVHPCADVFPMMSDDDLRQLGDDILARGGLTANVVFWTAPGGQRVLLDGRNRLEALERLGAVWHEADTLQLPGGPVIHVAEIKPTESVDPAAYVISANLRRRHLTKEEQAELIIRTIEVAKNDGAKMARSFSPTTGKRGGSTKDPVLATAIEEGAKHDISARTMKRARATAQGKTSTKTSRTIRRETATSAAAPQDRKRQPEEQKERDAQRTVARQMIETGYQALASKLHLNQVGSREDARLQAVRTYLRNMGKVMDRQTW